MKYEVKIVSSIDDLDRTEWDQLNGTVPFGSSRWLHVAEFVSNNLKPFYVLLYDGNQLLGTAAAFLTRQTGVPISSAVGRRLVSSMVQRYPLLVCRSPFGGDSGFRLPPGREAPALQEISRVLQEVARAHHVSFLVLGWLTAAELEFVKRAGDFEYAAMDSATSLKVAWSSFDQFAAGLGKSMQKDMRRHDNRARQLGITIERSRRFTQYESRLYELIDNVERHHGNDGLKPYADQVLRIIERDLPDKSVMLLAWVGSMLAGCGLLLHDNGVLTLTLLGLDYRFKYVYFQLFYETIRYAIDAGHQVIHGGTGAYEFKHRLGFQDHPTFAAFNSRQPILQWVGKQLARTINGGAEQLTVS